MLRTLRFVALLSLLLAAPASAQDGGGLLDINTGLMVWTLLIFGIVLFILYRSAYPKILGAVEARERHIAELLSAAARDREEAQTLLEEQKREREAMRTQVQEMVAEGRTAGERLRDEILGDARREQQEILERTRRDIQQEMDRSLAELRVQAVDLAIAAAGKLVHRNLDQEDNRRLAREYLEKIEIKDRSAAAIGA